MKICAGFQTSMGLSNRLRALLSTMRIADLNQIPFCLYWPKTIEVPCEFYSLFKMPVELVPEMQGDAIYIDWRLWVHESELPEGWAKAYPAENVRGRAIDYEYHRIPLEIRQSYLKYIDQLAPLDSLVQRADAICTGRFAAVHIRNSKDWAEWGRHSPMDVFFQAMDRCHPDTRFFVSAHLPEAITQLQQRYPGRILFQADKDYHETTSKRITDAMVDLLCLSRGEELIGSWGSTFTEMAWWFGRCRQNVTLVMGDLTNYKFF